MKVLQLGPYPPPHGGVQTNLVAIRRFLRERGVPCAVINLTRHRQANTDDVYYPQTALEVFKLLRRLPADIIHLHLGGHVTPRLLGLGLACCSLPGRRAVLTFHSGGYPLSAAGQSARPYSLRGFVFRRFDKIIAVNEQIVEMFRRFGVPSQRIQLILPHALSTPPLETELPGTIKSFFTSHGPVILSVGLLEPEYDLALQIEALGRVRPQFPNAGLVIIGSGSLEADLRRQIDEKPYGPHVLLCGDVPHDATLRAITKSDLFLRTTLHDGDSISVREALHLGVPVIATDNGMRPEGVVLVPPAQLDALCDVIRNNLVARVEAPSGAAAGEENLAAVMNLYWEVLENRTFRGGGGSAGQGL
ncbi:MAG: glycosyltransferase family 4 protein [Pyrinomonadaceae bacterium]